MNAPARLNGVNSNHRLINRDLKCAVLYAPDTYDVERGLGIFKAKLQGISDASGGASLVPAKTLEGQGTSVLSLTSWLGGAGLLTLSALAYFLFTESASRENDTTEILPPIAAVAQQSSQDLHETELESESEALGQKSAVRSSASLHTESLHTESQQSDLNRSEHSVLILSKPRPSYASPPRQFEPTATLKRDSVILLETSQLAQVRKLLVGDPAAALQLAEEGHSQFPGGMLRQEREALAILSLEKLGRSSEVRSRTLQFSERYPASALLPKLEGLQGKSNQ